MAKIFLSFGHDYITKQKITRRRDLILLGSEYGGWVIPVDGIDAESTCYCIGCGEDISFDLALLGRFGCSIFAFDPTPRAVKYVDRVAGGNPRYHFEAIGLWDKQDTLEFFAPENPDHVSHSLVNLQGTQESISVKVDRLSAVMKRFGHSRLDLLKLDIEGAEYKVLDSIHEDRIDVRVLCVEFDECHHALDKNYKSRITHQVRRLLDSGYELACVQGGGNYTFIRPS